MLYGHGILDVPGASNTPQYIRWMSMLQRCYDEGALSRDPSYRGVTVCDEWLTFSNFKAWMDTKDWEGKCLDKDLKSGSVYSPETCLFISEGLNRYWVMKHNGCSWEKDRKKWRVRPKLPGGGGHIHLGRYDTEEEARQVYEAYKLHGLGYFLGEESEEVNQILRELTCH